MGRAQSGPISKIRQGGLAFNGIGAIGAVVARFVHTEEVTGSNPVSPTNEWPVPLNQRDGPFRFSGGLFPPALHARIPVSPS